MKNYKELGGMIGALIGCVLTGGCVYITGSVWSPGIPFVSLLLGEWIGKSVVIQEGKYKRNFSY